MDFDEAYKALTLGQKKAVDTVEGPVLVIAGPGTGKTHVLTLRVANILKVTQANPGNILVLTFTESAAKTVRKRLIGLIGETSAQEIFISTFHGFAEHLLKEFGDSFPKATGKRLAGDVEATLLWREVLETEDMVHLRTTKSPYFYLPDLARLRNDLVRERISLSEYRAWAEEEAERLRNDESLAYVRGEKQGQLKPEGVKKIERLEKVHEAARLIEAYEALKEARGVYDFADVLLLAVDGVRENADLRASIQEQYQYVLADEHQDANALQHALLDLLAYDEHPNLFVVGDEKQAIYRFQGADSSHFKAFIESYPRAEVVVLSESHRSRQGLLDRSHGVIGSVPSALGEHALLTATREGEASIEVLAAPDPLAERDQVSNCIEEAIKSGTLPHEIAVISSRNLTADMFAEHLSARGVPVLRAGDVLLSSRPLLRFVLALMRAIAGPLDISSLRESLLAPWWQIPLADRAALMLKSRDRDFIEALTKAYPDVAERIRTLQIEARTLPPLQLLSKALEMTGARGYMLSHAEHLEDLTLLRKIFMHVEEIVARDPNLSFPEVVDTFTKAHEHELESIRSAVTLKPGFVTVITAHKAKGMEFEKVFIVGANAREWERGGMPPKIPSPIDTKRSLDDVTRLFYVAMTRAKDSLVISYSRETGEGRDLPSSSLIPAGLPEIAPVSDPLPLLHTNAEASKVARDLVCRYLTEEGLSPSAMSEYLESPPVFFAHRVLRLRDPDTAATVIGSAVHAGIAEFLSTHDETKAQSQLAYSLERSLLPRNAAYSRVVDHAQRSLAAYIAQAGDEEAVAIEKLYTVTRLMSGQEVILQGKVDAVFSANLGDTIVDFKTASEVNQKDPAHVLQLAFYDFLLREAGRSPARASIIQVGVDEVKEYPIALDAETRAAFLQTLAEVIEELVSCKWRSGKASPYDDLLTLFTQGS